MIIILQQALPGWASQKGRKRQRLQHARGRRGKRNINGKPEGTGHMKGMPRMSLHHGVSHIPNAAFRICLKIYLKQKIEISFNFRIADR
jgi:hypothetical protein